MLQLTSHLDGPFDKQLTCVICSIGFSNFRLIRWGGVEKGEDLTWESTIHFDLSTPLDKDGSHFLWSCGLSLPVLPVSHSEDLTTRLGSNSLVQPITMDSLSAVESLF